MNSGSHADFTISCGRINQYLDDLYIHLGIKSYYECKREIMISLREAMNAGGDMVADIARKTYTAPARKLRREILIHKNPYMDAVMLRVYGGRGVSLMNYHPDPSSPDKHPPPGVIAQVRRAGSRHPWRSKDGGSKSFIAPKNNGGVGVFVNHGIKKVRTVPGKRKGRTKKIYTHILEMLYGPSPIQAVMQHEKQQAVADEIEEVFVNRMNSRLPKILEKIAGGAK